MQRPGSIVSLLLAAFGLLGLMPAAAGDLSDPEFRKQVAERFPDVSARHIQPSPAAGLYRISQGGVVGYITADGRYLLDGDLIDLEENVNHAERERRRWRMRQIEALDEAGMVVFSPREPQHSLTIFTDIDCAYCRKLHGNIDELLDAGIRVRYLAFPLAGPGSQSFRKAQAVWCSADRKAALTRAKRGQSVTGKPGCNARVDEQFRLAFNTLGLRGTPTIVAQDGEILPPGLSMAELIQHVRGSQAPD